MNVISLGNLQLKMQCTICLSSDGILNDKSGCYRCKCRIFFHEKCFYEWTRTSVRCPWCKSFFKGESVPSYSEGVFISTLVHSILIYFTIYTAITSSNNEIFQQKLKLVLFCFLEFIFVSWLTMNFKRSPFYLLLMLPGIFILVY